MVYCRYSVRRTKIARRTTWLFLTRRASGMVTPPDLAPQLGPEGKKRKKSTPLGLFVASVLGALIAFVIVISFVTFDKRHANRLLGAVRRGLEGRPAGPDKPPEPVKEHLQPQAKPAEENKRDSVVVKRSDEEKKPNPPQPSRPSVPVNAKQLKPDPEELTERERWFLQAAEADREEQIRHLATRIEAAEAVAKSGKTANSRNEALKTLVNLRDDAEGLLSHPIPRAPILPRTLLAVGIVGRVDRGAIRVLRVIDDSRMVVELYSSVKETDSTQFLDDDSILNEGHPVLLSGVTTKNVVDGARQLLNETLVVSGTYRAWSVGTIYQVEPLKMDLGRVSSAFKTMAAIDDQDPMKREQLSPLQKLLAAPRPQEIKPRWPSINLATAKDLIKSEHYAAATRFLREIIDEAPLSNESVEAQTILKSLPADKVTVGVHPTP
jgi:hypothetical protein